MKIISLNVGLPREIVYKDRSIVTGIFKEPVEGRIRARRLNLDGDRQADLRVHGGAEKAVYAYPSEHYDYWRAELPDMKLPWGMFGENFTVEGLDEKKVNIGDRFRIGDALFMVTQPRMPCYKLAAKFERDDMIKRFLRSRRTGFYFSVIEEGEVGAGDAIELVSKDENNITVTNITQLYVGKGKDQDLLRRAAVLEALPASWRDYFRDRIEEH
ncbi:MAG TPA: MOSC domain-containing protein [Blastocatellia bacterium]|nr:MOSC domain-containing protein [Blastocatellia bacterium]